jgi:5'-3' exonuclease
MYNIDRNIKRRIPGMSKRAILVIDGNNIAWRAASFIPLERFREEGDGLSTSLLDHMLSKRMREMADDGYDSVIPFMAFDAGYKPIINDAKVNRYELFKTYKANRKDDHKDPDVTELNHLRSLWKNHWRDSLLDQGVVVVEHPCVEGDDIISYASDLISHSTGEDTDVAIWTVDKDLMQCVSDDPSHKVIMYRKRLSKVNGKTVSEERLVDGAEVLSEKGVPPEKVRMQLALAGDGADDYAGIKGYGGKLGIKIVNASDGINDLKENLKISLSSKKNPPSDEELKSIDDALIRNWTLAGCGKDWMPTTAQRGVEVGVDHILNAL